MQFWKVSFLSALAAVLVSGVARADYSQSVVCTKHGGVDWTVVLNRVEGNRFDGYVVRNGLELYGPHSVPLDMFQTNPLYWTSQSGWATLNISGSDKGILQLSVRYNFTVRDLECSDGVVSESSPKAESAVGRVPSNPGLAQVQCAISDRNSENVVRIPVDVRMNSEILPKPIITHWQGKQVQVEFTRPGGAESHSSLRMQVDDTVSDIDYPSMAGLFQLAGSDYVLDCNFR